MNVAIGHYSGGCWVPMECSAILTLSSILHKYNLQFQSKTLDLDAKMTWYNCSLLNGQCVPLNGAYYQNGLPEWTFKCVLEYFSFCF